MILWLSGWSYGQDKDSIKVSKNALIECELDHAQLVFVSAQLDSIVKSPKVTRKEKLTWAGVGFGSGILTIIILRLAIK